MKGQGGGSSNSYDNLAAVATFKNQPSTYFFSNLSSVGAARWSFQNAPSYKYYIPIWVKMYRLQAREI